MDKIGLLRERKAALVQAGEKVRAEISALADEESFVELSAFSFSEEEYGKSPAGEGVVTGFCTIGGDPFYVVAQNFAQDLGGLTKAHCEKIAKTLNAAEKNETPVVWLLNCRGAKLGEGVNVLEGIAELLLKATQLKGTVPQYAIIAGEVYGAAAAIAAIADVVFFLKEGALAVSSPLVLSAKAGKELKKEEVGGYQALRHALLPAVTVKDVEEAAAHIRFLTGLFSGNTADAELNAPAPVLETKAGAAELLPLIEDRLEIGANCAPEIKTVLGRLGGIAVAAAVFDGMRITAENMKKLRNFAELACCYGLPFVLFVDCLGVEESLAVNDSSVLREIAEYLNILDAIDTAKISVVTGSAAGLGYSLFAAKSAGYDYTYALATSRVSLFESRKGAEIFYGGADGALLEKYDEEHADPVNAARGGYLDNVIEPRFLKQYLIASLQTLVR